MMIFTYCICRFSKDGRRLYSGEFVPQKSSLVRCFDLESKKVIATRLIKHNKDHQTALNIRYYFSSSTRAVNDALCPPAPMGGLLPLERLRVAFLY